MAAKPLAAIRKTRRRQGFFPPEARELHRGDDGDEPRDCERRFERTLERVKRERLDEVRRRLQAEHFGIRRIDAREKHGNVARAEVARDRQSRGLARLDHGGVDADVIDVTAHEGDGFVPEPADDELQQSADVVVRFADEDPCHSPRIDDGRRDWASGMV